MDPSKIRETKGNYTAEQAAKDADVAPKRVLADIIKDYKNARDVAVAQQKKAETEAKEDKRRAETATSDRGAAKAEFDKVVEGIKADQQKINAANTTSYNDLKAGIDAKGKKLEDNLIKYNKTRDALEKEKDDLAKKFEDARQKLEKYDKQTIATTLTSNSGPDYIAQDEKKGEIVGKESNFTRLPIPNPGPFSTLEGGTRNETKGNFVTINLGSSQKLKPGISFAVLPSGATWRTEQEKIGLIKGQVEVVEVLGPNLSRAKVIDEKEPLRDPIQTKDQLYNLGWNPDEEIRVAFAGLIDLDGACWNGRG
jgi:hypothetical protein